MWSGARTSSPASIVASAHLPAAFRSTARSFGSNCNRSPKAPAAPPRSYGRSRHPDQHDGQYLQSVGNLWAPTASDIEGPTDLDWVSLCFETEISRCALDSCMAQERSNCLQIARAFQNVESLRPA